MEAPQTLKANRVLQVGLFFIAVVLTISCKSSKAGTDTPSQSLETLINLTKERLGENATTDFNKSKSHALVALITASSKTSKSVRFFVYEVKIEEVILEDFVSQGSIEWLDDSQIKVNKIPGRPGPQASRGYIFNTKTKKKDQLPL